ncbi:MAG: endonuclease III [Nanoarchaeota archaeon]|nr:endonuclease III [Nanoarchaeota archaeon]
MNNITKIIKILEEKQKNLRRTTLNREAKDTKHFTPFQTLISCIISLRVKDETTEKIIKKLFSVAKTPEDFVKIPIKKLEELIYSSGYYKNKAKVIKKISKDIIEKYNGKVPDTEEELMKLYGVGRKTCNIVLSFAYGKNVIAVDTHLNRIPNRLGIVNTKNPEQTELALMKVFPKKYWKELNGIFILHGKIICLPKNPHCWKCPISKYCKRIGIKRSR